MINFLWVGLIVFGIVYMLVTGNASGILEALMSGSANAIEVSLSLAGIYCFWLGIMNIAKDSGLIEKLSSLLSPVMKLLFPKAGKDARNYISMNLSANVLGLGNAATPFGLSAMKSLQKENPDNASASDSMILFLILNTTSLQLIPTTVISLRSTYGAEMPSSIVLPSIIATAIPAVVGIVLCKLLAKRSR